MLVTSIKTKDHHAANQQINSANVQADAIELRIDYSNSFNLNKISLLLKQSKLPIIFTLRKKSQGGFYQYGEDQRLTKILALCQLNPDYIDPEHDIQTGFLKDVKSAYPDIKLICSYHNFNETPTNLESILQSMENPFFYAYKIATLANKTSDSLRMLNFVKKFHKKYILTGICMGEYGICTRILSPIIGNAMNYTSLDEAQATAPGQLTANELMKLYHYQKLNSESKIYALLGDPINLSAGHILHNEAIEYLNQNAIYIKLRTTTDDLPKTIEQCHNLPFFGFSITMPLKEAIFPLLDEIQAISQPIKAINSVTVHNNKYTGFNTDGIGAIQTLNKRINIAKQKIIVLGSGGAARAIIYEALQNKAEVIILNRTLTKAMKLADEFGCKAYDLNNLTSLKKLNYVAIINTIPNNAYSEEHTKKLLNSNHFLPNAFAMDIVYQPMDTLFLQAAQKAHCTCIYGYEIYISQALIQIKKWFNPNENQINEIKNRMKEYFLERCQYK